MKRVWRYVFIDHPQSVDETYLQHLFFAGWFASRLFTAGFAALTHALIPCFFEKTASNIIKQMHTRLTNRH